MRLRMLVVPAVLLAVGLPAQARAASFSGIVVAKQPAHGTLLVAGAHGAGLTVRGSLARAAVGERVSGSGTRLRDGTLRMSRLHAVARVHDATLRGTVLRKLARSTLVASGRSVVLIHARARQLASADDHGGLRVGDVGEFRVRFDDDDNLVEDAPPTQVGQAGTARIEGTVMSVSPLVVRTETVPLTITVPAGTTLPATLAVGQRIELTVEVGAANTFTLVAIDDEENAVPAVQVEEVEVKGFVTSSTPSQIVVNVNGTTFTFAAAAGATLPVLPVGSFVEARGVKRNGAITLTRLEVEDGDDGGHGGSGHH